MIPTKNNGQAALLVLLFGDKVANEKFYFRMKVDTIRNKSDIIAPLNPKT